MPARGKTKPGPTEIYTIGHSTLTVHEFLARLKAHGIERLVDVRTVPRSRHNPQFNRAELARRVRNTRRSYRWLKGLGGLRHARKDSPNAGWRNASFRGYADYMQTAEFATYLNRLIVLAGQKRTAFMCAEALPWRCHRWLVSDALTVRGLKVFHIMGSGKPRPHRLTSWAKVSRGKITYPQPAEELVGVK